MYALLTICCLLLVRDGKSFCLFVPRGLVSDLPGCREILRFSLRGTSSIVKASATRIELPPRRTLPELQRWTLSNCVDDVPNKLPCYGSVSGSAVVDPVRAESFERLSGSVRPHRIHFWYAVIPHEERPAALSALIKTDGRILYLVRRIRIILKLLRVAKNRLLISKLVNFFA